MSVPITQAVHVVQAIATKINAKGVSSISQATNIAKSTSMSVSTKASLLQTALNHPNTPAVVKTAIQKIFAKGLVK